MFENLIELLEWYANANDQDRLRDRGERAQKMMDTFPEDFAQRLDDALEGVLGVLPDCKEAEVLTDLLDEVQE